MSATRSTPCSGCRPAWTEAAVRGAGERAARAVRPGALRRQLGQRAVHRVRRLVDLAAVVAHAADVVLLDEPSSGVAQREVEAMAELLRRVQRPARRDAARGRARHRVHRRSGRPPGGAGPGPVLASGEPASVLAAPQVAAAFLGVPTRSARSGARWTSRGPDGLKEESAVTDDRPPVSRPRSRTIRRAALAQVGRVRRYGPVLLIVAALVAAGVVATAAPTAVTRPRRLRRARPPGNRSGRARARSRSPTHRAVRQGGHRRTTMGGRLRHHDRAPAQDPDYLRPAVRPAVAAGTTAGARGPACRRPRSTSSTTAAAGRPRRGPAGRGRHARRPTWPPPELRGHAQPRRTPCTDGTSTSFPTGPPARPLTRWPRRPTRSASLSRSTPSPRSAAPLRPRPMRTSWRACTCCASTAASATCRPRYQQDAPYLWGSLPDVDTVLTTSVDYVIKQLNARPAIWAGDRAWHTRRRQFAFVNYVQSPPSPGSERLTEQITRRAAGRARLVRDPAFADVHARPEHAARSGRDHRGEAEGVGCHDGHLRRRSDHADLPDQGVRGDRLLPRVGHHRHRVHGHHATLARFYNQSEWAHAFGISSLPVPTPITLSDAYRLYSWWYGGLNAPPSPTTAQVILPPILQLFEGLQLAGPHLTPSTFAAGMFGAPKAGGGPTAPLQAYGDAGRPPRRATPRRPTTPSSGTTPRPRAPARKERSAPG